MLLELQLPEQSCPTFSVDPSIHTESVSIAAKQQYATLVSIIKGSRNYFIHDLRTQVLAFGTWASLISLLSIGSCGGPLWIIALGGMSEACYSHLTDYC